MKKKVRAEEKSVIDKGTQKRLVPENKTCRAYPFYDEYTLLYNVWSRLQGIS